MFLTVVKLRVRLKAWQFYVVEDVYVGSMVEDNTLSTVALSTLHLCAVLKICPYLKQYIDPVQTHPLLL